MEEEEEGDEEELVFRIPISVILLFIRRSDVSASRSQEKSSPSFPGLFPGISRGSFLFISTLLSSPSPPAPFLFLCGGFFLFISTLLSSLSPPALLFSLHVYSAFLSFSSCPNHIS